MERLRERERASERQPDSVTVGEQRARQAKNSGRHVLHHQKDQMQNTETGMYGDYRTYVPVCQPRCCCRYMAAPSFQTVCPFSIESEERTGKKVALILIKSILKGKPGRRCVVREVTTRVFRQCNASKGSKVITLCDAKTIQPVLQRPVLQE
jgi:hypothetical protein